MTASRIIGTLVLLLTASGAEAGAWGVGPFDNDDALDFVEELVRTGETAIADALGQVTGSARYLEAPRCSAAIAAAEVVAALRGRARSGYPESVVSWLASHETLSAARFLPAARKALKAVGDSERSELAQLWSENTSEHSNWVQEIGSLEIRLAP